MSHKYSLFVILLLFLCLLFVAPSFAMDNQTSNIMNGDEDVLSVSHYYFDVNNDDNGNGSFDNPYNKFNSSILKDNSIIHLANGEYNFSSSKSFENITFYGNSSESVLNFNNYTLTNSKSLKFVNITLKNVNIVNSGTLNGVNTIFKDSPSLSKEFGGAIYSNGHDIYLNNCEFRNFTGRYGGVFYIVKGNLEINNSIFEDNHALVFGGVVTSVMSNVRLNNISSRNNKADCEGGVVYSFYGNFSIVNSNLFNNTARNGGALYIDNNDNAVFINNSFINNSALNLAGAVYSLANHKITCENNTFTNNDLVNKSIPSLIMGDGNYTMYMYNQSVVESLPDSYNLCDHGYVTPVKNQGSGGNCWSFALLAALESCILKASGVSFDFSEENVKNLMALYSDYGWLMETNDGGYDDMGVGYVVSWLGPVLESDDVYDASSILSPVLNSILHIQNVIFIKRDNYTDNDGIKRAILQYGAVATSIRWTGGSVKDNARYYSGIGNSNHAVTIVGWDDNYSRNNFAKTPPGDGAWIIKNSHGTSSGKNGYWYVSYYDVCCAQVGRSDVSFTFILNDTLKYDKNYQYDIQGRTDYFLNSSNTVWYKNVFNASDDEYLAAVSTYFEKVSNYAVYINVNGQLKHVQNGTIGAGYYTIKLTDNVVLSKGDVFEVIFKISTDKNAGFPISEKISLVKCTYYENISFLSYDGDNWLDLYNLSWKYSSHTYSSQVACIKAFTFYNVVNTSINLSYSIEDVVNVRAEVFNQYGFHVDGGNVIFNVDGFNQSVGVKNGFADLVLERHAKDYSINVFYNATGYNSSKNNISFNVPKIKTNISLNISSVFNPINIVAVVLDEYGCPVLDGILTFNLDGDIFTRSIVNGSVVITKIFDVFNTHNISVYYDGSLDCIKSNISESFNVSLKNTHIQLNISGVFNPVNITVVVLDEYGCPVLDGILTFNLDGDIFTRSIVNGSVVITKIFDAFNTHNISVYYDGSLYFNKSNISESFNVSLKNTNILLNTSEYNPIIISIKVVDEFEEYVKLGNVSIKINEDIYLDLELINGTVNFTHNLDIALNKLTIMYNMNDYYNLSNIDYNLTVKPSIFSFDSVKALNSMYSATFLNSEGNQLSNADVTFIIDSQAYYAKTNDMGVASVNINLNPGMYNVVILNPTTLDNNTQIINVLPRISNNLDLTMYYGADKYYKVRVCDDDGNYKRGIVVSFILDNVHYSATTDDNGYAFLKINLGVGKHKFYSEYKGYKVSNTITVKTILITKNIKVKRGKTIKFTAKLLNTEGKILKGKKVTFKFIGKKYKIKTNKKGMATLKIYKKLKVGKYKITSSYSKLKIKNTIKIKN